MNKPKINIQTTKVDWTLEIIALSGVILTILFVLVYYKALPDTIPQHFNLNGSPDGFGAKSILFVLPVVAIVIYAMMTAGLRFPQLINYPVPITNENAERQYKNVALMLRVLKCLMTLSFSFLTFATIQNGLGRMDGLGTWAVPAMLFTLLGTVGFFIYRGFKLR